MPIYCLCEAQPGTPGAGKPDAQVYAAPNRYCSTKDPTGRELPAEKFPPVALQRAMRVVAIGVVQVVFHGQSQPLLNLWEGGGRPSGHEHYPRVDVLECPVCKARVVLEGFSDRRQQLIDRLTDTVGRVLGLEELRGADAVMAFGEMRSALEALRGET